MNNMKIAVCSDDGKTVAGHLGRARGFVIFDVEDGKIRDETYIENIFTPHFQGGAGHQEADMESKHGSIISGLAGCSVVIAAGMGRRIYDDLAAAGMTPVVARQSDAHQAIEDYIAGTLEDHPDATCEH